MAPTIAPQKLSRPNSNDLWALATSKLSEDDRCNIDFSYPKLKILSDLQNLTEQSRLECIGKRWGYKRKSGETVILRDLFGKAAKWIDLFKQVGDNAVQYDPIHAALPWAGVRFLLQIAIDDIAKFAFVVESASTITQLICRYAVFEDLYLRHDTPTTRELEDALVQLYTGVMIYLAKAKSYFEQNSSEY